MEEQTSITTLLSELEQAHGALNDRWKLMLEVYEGAV